MDEENMCLYAEIRNAICHQNVELIYMNDCALIKMFMEKNENSLKANVDFILNNEEMLQIVSHRSYTKAFRNEPELNWDSK
jgi:hypothetical protein